MSYHFNPSTGNPGLCRAKLGGCPFGTADEHYPSKEEAAKGFEKMSGGAFEKGAINLDSRGYFTEDTEALVTVNGMSCPRCARPLKAKELLILTDDLNEMTCPCGKDLSIYEVELTIPKGHPSHRFIENKDAVKDVVWYHASTNENWLGEDANPNSKKTYDDGTFKAHVGSQQAAYDRAISQLVVHDGKRKSADEFWLYEVRVKPDAKVSEIIAADEGSDTYSPDDPEVELYENRFEDPASISLAIRSDKIEILGKGKISKSQAHRRLSISSSSKAFHLQHLRGWVNRLDVPSQS